MVVNDRYELGKLVRTGEVTTFEARDRTLDRRVYVHLIGAQDEIDPEEVPLPDRVRAYLAGSAAKASPIIEQGGHGGAPFVITEANPELLNLKRWMDEHAPETATAANPAKTKEAGTAQKPKTPEPSAPKPNAGAGETHHEGPAERSESQPDPMDTQPWKPPAAARRSTDAPAEETPARPTPATRLQDEPPRKSAATGRPHLEPLRASPSSRPTPQPDVGGHQPSIDGPELAPTEPRPTASAPAQPLRPAPIAEPTKQAEPGGMLEERWVRSGSEAPDRRPLYFFLALLAAALLFAASGIMLWVLLTAP